MSETFFRIFYHLSSERFEKTFSQQKISVMKFLVFRTNMKMIISVFNLKGIKKSFFPFTFLVSFCAISHKILSSLKYSNHLKNLSEQKAIRSTFSIFPVLVPEPNPEEDLAAHRARIENEIKAEYLEQIRANEKLISDAKREADELKQELQNVQKKHADEKEQLKNVCLAKCSTSRKNCMEVFC